MLCKVHQTLSQPGWQRVRRANCPSEASPVFQEPPYVWILTERASSRKELELIWRHLIMTWPTYLYRPTSVSQNT